MSQTILPDSAAGENSCAAPLCTPDAAVTAYTFLRHTGFILDELSAQGLELWRDDNNRWQWRWQGTDLKSSTGFWAMGEALVDAVIGRFPETFSRHDTVESDCAAILSGNR
jgi:hypothetical protein